MTPRDLADFRARLPECDLAVYADIASGTVLGADGIVRYPQEYLDALCNCAAQLLQREIDGHGPEHALFLGPTGARAFIRPPSEPGEALCLVCGPDVAFERMMSEARAALAAAARDQAAE